MMTKQGQLLSKIHRNLGDLVALSAFDQPVPTAEIDEAISMLKMARSGDEPQSFNPVAKKMADLATQPWPNQPSEQRIREIMAIGANEINRILGLDDHQVIVPED